MVDSTSALFSRTSRYADRIIVPVSDSALSHAKPRKPFYCVHSVSGAAGTDFIELAGHLDPVVEFFGIQAPPKRLADASFGGNLGSLAAIYTDALTEFQPTGPLVLGGYCVGAVIVLEMARLLRARGRTVGPLVVIDGVPENTGVAVHRWRPGYWIELARKLPGWLKHADLMRNMTWRSLYRSVSKNIIAIGKGAVGRTRFENLLGGYSIEGQMDLSDYPVEQRAFINRLLSALFLHEPEAYSGDVVVYEAQTTPLLFLPQIGRIWLKFAPQSKVASIVGTHISMLHEPYVSALAADLRDRLSNFFAANES
jgi:thioesterase domain-containing protein